MDLLVETRSALALHVLRASTAVSSLSFSIVEALNFNDQKVELLLGHRHPGGKGRSW